MDEKLLERYFKGKCTPGEVQQVLDWFAAEELRPEQEQQLYQVWQDLEAKQAAAAFAPHAGRILAGIHAALNQQEQQAAKPPRAPGRWRWVVQAAAVLLPLACLWLFSPYPGDGHKAAGRLVTVAAPAGIRKTIHLADGSKVYLNSGSKLVYPAPFAGDKRAVTLIGEAFFAVAKDSLRPFIVRTGPLLTRVTGTSFNIKYRRQENKIAVALATGKVAIEKQSGGGMARLEPGQQLVYDQASRSCRIGAYDRLKVLGWRAGILHFEQASFQEVVDQLATWYGVDITVAGSVKEKQWQYTGAYHHQGLDQVLEGIAFVKGFSYVHQGNKVTISFK
jgi:transmembrane sensor